MKTNSKILKIIIILLLIIVILLIVDLLLDYRRCNKYNLYFDSNEFNNILTPILTLIATTIYGIALFLTIKQNKIILSQNIKPHYLDEIKKIEKKAKKSILKQTGQFKKEEINVTNYINYIFKSLSILAENEEYREDYKNYTEKSKITKEHIRKRNYYPEILFLTNFTFQLNNIYSIQSEAISLMQEINLSKLIKEDKDLLNKQLFRFFFKEYVAFIEFEDKHDFVPQIPIMYYRPTTADLYFEKLSQTNFRNLYAELKNEILINNNTFS